MAIYRFKISFEDFDEVVREIDIKSNQTFEDLHLAIHKSTGYSPEKSSSFYVSTDHWIKGDEIAYMPTDRKVERGVVLMEKSKLSSFIEDPHQKFYYIYNFERPFDFHVELVKIILDADPNVQYPSLFKKVGEAPKIIDKNNGTVAVSSNPVSTEFDFLNELNFVSEDSEELEAMGGNGINEEEKEEGEEETEESDDFSDTEHFGDEEYDSKEDY
jgi:hypothetical protein